RVFFFQAEDGIRDFHVTGVQTCALPISPRDLTGRARVSRCRAPMTWFRRLGQRFEDARFRGAAALIVAVIAGLSIGFVLVPRAPTPGQTQLPMPEVRLLGSPLGLGDGAV